MSLKKVNEMSSAKLRNCATFAEMRQDLLRLQELLESSENEEEAAEITRKCVNALLKLITHDETRAELDLTELEIARLKNFGPDGGMTKAVRYKLRIYLDTFLRDNLGI